MYSGSNKLCTEEDFRRCSTFPWFLSQWTSSEVEATACLSSCETQTSGVSPTQQSRLTMSETKMKANQATIVFLKTSKNKKWCINSVTRSLDGFLATVTFPLNWSKDQRNRKCVLHHRAHYVWNIECRHIFMIVFYLWTLTHSDTSKEEKQLNHSQQVESFLFPCRCVFMHLQVLVCHNQLIARDLC